MRVILDTNVLLSAFLRVDSNPYKVVQAWIDGRFELVSSVAQIEKVARVSSYPRIRELIGSAEIGWLVPPKQHGLGVNGTGVARP